jgi:hypothetical protein
VRIVHPEFRNENLDSLYPFADTATLLSRDKISLTPDMLIDAVVYPIGAGPRVYISSLEVSNRVVTIWIGDATRPQLASGSFDPLAPPNLIALADGYGRPAGLFVADPILLASAQSWPTGAHVFDIGATEFAASCTISTPEEGVRGLLASQGILLTGDTWIIGENGIQVSLDDDGSIRVDVVGDPLFARRLCYPAQSYSPPRFVKTINGIAPDSEGNFQIAVANASAPDTVLRIVPKPPDTLIIGLVGSTVHGVQLR